MSVAGGSNAVRAQPSKLVVVREGWLNKEGALFKTWKRRWFLIIEPRHVFYFEDEKQCKYFKDCWTHSPDKARKLALGELQCDSSVQVLRNSTKGKTHCFTVKPTEKANRIYYCQAFNDKEMKEWMEAMELGRVRASVISQQPPPAMMMAVQQQQAAAAMQQQQQQQQPQYVPLMGAEGAAPLVMAPATVPQYQRLSASGPSGSSVAQTVIPASNDPTPAYVPIDGVTLPSAQAPAATVPAVSAAAASNYAAPPEYQMYQPLSPHAVNASATPAAASATPSATPVVVSAMTPAVVMGGSVPLSMVAAAGAPVVMMPSATVPSVGNEYAAPPAYADYSGAMKPSDAFVASGSWICNWCRYVNRSEHTTCDACHTARDSQQPYKPGASGLTPAMAEAMKQPNNVAAANAEWTCETCSLRNKPSVMMCAVCNSPRGAKENNVEQARLEQAAREAAVLRAKQQSDADAKLALELSKQPNKPAAVTPQRAGTLTFVPANGTPAAASASPMMMMPAAAASSGGNMTMVSQPLYSSAQSQSPQQPQQSSALVWNPYAGAYQTPQQYQASQSMQAQQAMYGPSAASSMMAPQPVVYKPPPQQQPQTTIQFQFGGGGGGYPGGYYHQQHNHHFGHHHHHHHQHQQPVVVIKCVHCNGSRRYRCGHCMGLTTVKGMRCQHCHGVGTSHCPHC